MFISEQNERKRNKYISLLQKVGALSRLFSDNTTPYLPYRTAENIFCRSFEAENKSRSDTAADAVKDTLGFGLKTFIALKNHSWEKVAEFNKKRPDYESHLDNYKKLIAIISDLRNKRLNIAINTYDIEDLKYHCIARQPFTFLLHEEQMTHINIEKIKITNQKSNTIYFNDGIGEYKFNISKSTLFKHFIINEPLSFHVPILKDPYEVLEELEYADIISEEEIEENIMLPLYSERGDNKYVPEKSGLNTWNAGGRPRDNREVYIRIPSWIHKEFPDFFPPRDTPFKLRLPDGIYISAKVCQDNSKALMSNPNSDLGQWLIDKVLAIEPGSIVTYELLEDIGIDTVEISKTGERNFAINFKSAGAFEEFQSKYKENN